MGQRLLILAVLCGSLAGCDGSENSSADRPSGAGPEVAGRLAFLPPEGTADPVRVVTADGRRRASSVGPAARIPWALSWAPDGRRVAYIYSSSSAARSVGILNVTSGRSAVLLESPPGASPVSDTWYQLAWAPSGENLALVSAPPGDASSARINVVDVQGSVVTRRLGTDVAPSSRISWSPDSARLVYSTGTHALRTVTVASDARMSVGRVLGSDPAWSPNGRLIALATPRGIAVVRPSGRGVRWLTRGGRRDKTPTWSPDGRWIAFARQTGGCNRPDARCEQDLYRVAAAGGTAELIRRTPKLIETSPVWAPR